MKNCLLGTTLEVASSLEHDLGQVSVDLVHLRLQPQLKLVLFLLSSGQRILIVSRLVNVGC